MGFRNKVLDFYKNSIFSVLCKMQILLYSFAFDCYRYMT